MPAKTSLSSLFRSLTTMFGTMSKKRRAAILATVAVLAVGGIVAGGLTVQNAAVAAEAAHAAEAAAAKQARVEAAAKQAAYEERVEAEALTTIEAATPVVVAAEGKVDATALATPLASLVERATLEVEIVEDLIEQAAAAIPVVQAAIDEADRLAAEAAAAAAAEAERVAAAEAAAAAAAAEAARAAAATPDGAKAIARDMASSKYGWGSDQFSCLVNLWQKESGWNVNAYNASSGATGIPQSLPGSKMATHGADWKTNASTQISWGLDYIKRAYGTPCGAWGHSQSVNWY